MDLKIRGRISHVKQQSRHSFVYVNYPTILKFETGKIESSGIHQCKQAAAQTNSQASEDSALLGYYALLSSCELFYSFGETRPSLTFWHRSFTFNSNKSPT
jgi:hypothetical protein